MNRIEGWCRYMRENEASDLFLHEGSVPRLRLQGYVRMLDEDIITAEEMDWLRQACGRGEDSKDFDATFVSGEGGRFRVNLFSSLGARGAILRQVKDRAIPLEDLGFSVELLTGWLSRRSGMILVSGPPGSGKSTTVAAMMDWLNANVVYHIVTIEDPIEYLHASRGCLFTQREVGIDTDSYATGLKQALRQSPDVIMIGEIRDVDTARICLQAAETGHMVVATVHGASVIEVIERLVRLFPELERDSIRMILGNHLTGVISQRLIVGMDGKLHLIAEHLDNEGASRRWVQESKFKELADLIGRQDNPGNCSLLNALVRACKGGVLSEEVALEHVGNPQDFQRAMKGITSGRG